MNPAERPLYAVTEPVPPVAEPTVPPEPTLSVAVPRPAHRFLTDVIVDLGLAPRPVVDEALERSRANGVPPERILLEDGAINSDGLARARAERYGLEHLDLNVYNVDPSAANLLAPDVARRYEAAPVAFVDDGTLLVAMSDPANVLAVDDIAIITGREVRVAVAASEDIVALIGRLDRLGDDVSHGPIEVEEEDTTEVVDLRESPDDAPVVRLVNQIVEQAVERGASDIHLAPEGGELRVRMRVDGVLQDVTTVSRRMSPAIVSRVKIMSDLDIAEKRMPQDGRIGISVRDKHIDLRVVTLPSVEGEGIVMRVLDKSSIVVELDRLGMADAERERFEDALRHTHGAVLVTGPTGSGKSTTLYGALQTAQHAREEHHHRRGPGRVRNARSDAGPGLRTRRPDVRRRAARDGPRRPRRDHGRRDPRPGDGAHRHQVGAHRPPRALDAPHERRAARDHAAASRWASSRS